MLGCEQRLWSPTAWVWIQPCHLQPRYLTGQVTLFPPSEANSRAHLNMCKVLRAPLAQGRHYYYYRKAPIITLEITDTEKTGEFLFHGAFPS